MATTLPRTGGTTLPQATLTVSSKRLRDISSKVLAEQVAAGEDGVIALTRYNNIYAYVIPAEVAEKAFRVQDASVSFLQDWTAAFPYIETALDAGVPIKRVLGDILKDNTDGQVAIDFAGLARLIAETPIRLDFNEDGTPLSRTNFHTFTHVAEDEDEDYTKFNVR